MESQGLSRMEKRKAAKIQKRKQMRTETAMRQLEEEEAWLNDPEEQARIRLMELEEAERCERDRREFEERERIWIEAAVERKRREEVEEEERRKILGELEKKEVEKNNGLSEDDDDWNYVEEGPAEILWQGDEIIVKKKRVRVSKKDVDQYSKNKDTDRPTSNPLPPQSQAFSDHNVSVISSQNLFADVSEQIPNFGTEQDKAHCPFHLKTGACWFGQRCSRVHFYPDKSCTLLIKNMYNGPGIAWEQDEGLEKFISRFIWWSSWF